ncbi:hypothetical protein PGTUg99_028623 [Puccinia graminis f. sp. tritici]|uniref:Secreted protein n=1 Tax=Puccinia graminis f. sp. tritici TaxID=56615 RepID=A0A5B0RLM4_PUCGR|nr:hypothetical protein PGTUg99_028623 [Puccinia graminis f. sp. tritici]
MQGSLFFCFLAFMTLSHQGLSMPTLADPAVKRFSHIGQNKLLDVSSGCLSWGGKKTKKQPPRRGHGTGGGHRRGPDPLMVTVATSGSGCCAP